MTPGLGRASWRDLALVVVLALTAHVLFSSLGFNPTDDGFVLAMSRRLLDGQVPHRDFISIRPVGSALLHAPLVLLGGEAVYWLGRLVAWFEFAATAWIWVVLLGRLMGRAWTWGERAVLTCIALILSAHTFPIMPWYTVDGLMLASLGLLLAGSSRTPVSATGCLLLGASALCKQNFLALLPLGLLFFRPARSLPCVLAAAAPILIYAACLVAMGASRDAVEQLGATTNVLGTSVWPWVGNPFLWCGAVAGVVILWMTAAEARAGQTVAPRLQTLGILAAAGLVLCAAATMLWHQQPYLRGGAFLIFGAALGVTAARWRRDGARDGRTRAGALVLFVAWASSVSLGYGSPALLAGALAVYFIASVCGPEWGGAGARTARFVAPGLAGLACLLALVWVVSRNRNIYHERPARELGFRLDGVLPGGKFIRTNRLTHAMMVDLRRAIERTEGRPFAIIPSFPGYWVKAAQRNPLSIDFADTYELSTPPLFERVVAELESLPPRGFIIMDKVDFRWIALGARPINDDDPFYTLVPYVRRHFRKVGETEWFELYQ